MKTTVQFCPVLLSSVLCKVPARPGAILRGPCFRIRRRMFFFGMGVSLILQIRVLTTILLLCVAIIIGYSEPHLISLLR